jgi:hypothetical protein
MPLYLRNERACDMTTVGPSRHFAAAQQLGRFWREADISWQARSVGSVANDPKQRFSILRKNPEEGSSRVLRDPGFVKTLYRCYDSAGELMRRFAEEADRGRWTLLPEWPAGWRNIGPSC